MIPDEDYPAPPQPARQPTPASVSRPDPARRADRERRPAAGSPPVPWAAFAVDVLLVVVFATIGRLSHAEGLSLGGIVTTASPFLAGTVGAWAVLAARGTPRPATLPAGALIWGATLVVGMALRAITGQGVAVSFVIVAGVVTAAFLIGWRALGAWLTRRNGG